MGFGGLTSEAIDFLDELKANNNREWFQDNKSRYVSLVKEPALEFGQQVSEGLTRLTGQSQKTKLFRVNRDLRFSKDKTPYNTHIHIAWTDLDTPRRPMWFWGLDTKGLAQGVGVFAFDKPGLGAFRDYVAGPDGADVALAIDEHLANGGRMSEPELKRVPPAYDADHPRRDQLRRKGISGWIDLANRDAALGASADERALDVFANLLPLYRAISGALGLAL